MKAAIKQIIKSLMPWYFRDMILYRRRFGHFPNLSNPQTFNEKIFKRKRTQCFDNELYSTLADKYKVRNFVSVIIGSEYLVPVIDVFSDVNAFKKNIFNYKNVVIKPNHGSGMVIFVGDYLKYGDAIKVIRDVKRWMRKDFSKIACEYHYRNIRRKLIVEQMLGDINSPPTDYKFHIFKKREGIFFVLQVVERNHERPPIFTTYVNNLEQPCKGYYSLTKEHINIARRALEQSIKLIYVLEYARIDWLVYDNQLYFSEITLTPASGYVTGLGKELDLLMGQQWDLPIKI